MSQRRDAGIGSRSIRLAPRRRVAAAAGAAATAAALILLAGAVPAGAGRGGAGEQERVKAMVRRGPVVDGLVAAGRLEVLEDYGQPASGGAPAALLVRGDPDALRAVETTPGAAGPRRVADRLHLRSRAVDTAPGRRFSPRGARSGSGRLEVVQFHGPIKKDWLALLRGRGKARPVAYLPENAYVVWVEDPEALASAGAPIQWQEALERRDRLSIDLPAAGVADVTVQLARAGSHDAVLEDLRARALAVLVEPRRIGAVTSVRLSWPAETLDDLAHRPEVLWVEPFESPRPLDERTALIAAGQVSQGRPLPPGYLSWLKLQGLSDLGSVLVDVTDTGVDAGGTAATHPGLQGRIAYSVDRTSEAIVQDCPGHGTNVAGILAGGPATPVIDAEGYRGGLGVAPTVRIGATRIFDCAGQFPAILSFSDAVADAYALGARIGNNSWGGQGSQYNLTAAEYDALARDANLDPSDGDQGFLAVFSAGNFGPSDFSVGWPASAKNVLTVGASEGFRPGFTDGCSVSSLQADSADHVAFFSSRGPTADGRRKPDIVAPGSHVVSLASSAPGYGGFGVCNRYFPEGQGLLSLASGTSQAAPHASAAAAIAVQIYRREFGGDPSPAMLKAMLINHARDLAEAGGVSSNTSKRPNNVQGWGGLNIGSLAEARGRAAVDQEVLFTATGDAARFGPLVVEDTASRTIVTLVWTDAPASPGGSAWVNDLDLVVEAAGTTYLGNVIADGESVSGGARDGRNNVESVILPPGIVVLEVTVEAANIAGDGVPSAPSETDQDFALYVSNARLASGSGQIAFLSAQASCGARLPVRIVDPGLRGLGRVGCVVASGGDSESLRLEESPAASGAFTGSVDVSAGAGVPGDGVLQVADLASVTATYTEVDPSSGEPVSRIAGVQARCDPPRISDVRVSRVGDTEATVFWRTDRPANSRVDHGPGGNRVFSRSDPRFVTDHEVRLTNLPTCTFQTAVVSATDPGGLTAAAPAAPLRFSTGGGALRRFVILRDDMESLSTRWTHDSLGGGLDEWELGFPGVGPPGPFSGRRVWGTDLDDFYEVGTDAVLVAPPLDLTGTVAPQITFHHYYAITGGNPPLSANDGGWLEISTDAGATWSPVAPVGGYPDTVDADNPYLPVGAGVFGGSQLGWSKTTVDLSPFAGRLALVRFHLWQDAAEQRPTAAGWYIDDFELTAQGRCHEGRVTLDSGEYGCSSRATITLADTDRNASDVVVETAPVVVSTPREEIPLTLRETAVASGVFRGEVQLSPIAGTAVLRVQEGDTLAVRYQDADAGGGVPALASASAVVPDCAPPPSPSDVTVTSEGVGTRLKVSWTPVDPDLAPDLQGYQVHYDGDGPGPSYTGTGALQGASPIRAAALPTSLPLSSLSPCARQFVTVTSFDRLGNESAFAVERIGVPPGTPPCHLARIVLDGAARGCSERVTVSVEDGNADPNPQTTGGLTVFARSDTQGQPLAVPLLESAPASGVFTGSFLLSPAPGSATLQVQEGDSLVVQYEDADDGLGGSRTMEASATAIDCTGPAISQVSVTGRGPDRAVVRWVTDEPATAQIRYGPDPSLGLTVSGPDGLRLDHVIPITEGLASCSPVFFSLTSVDVRSNASTEPAGPPPLYFGTHRDLDRFSDSLETGAPGWSHASLSGGPDEWELGAPAGVVVTGGPPSAFSGSAVWGTDLDGPYERGADLALVTPPVDLREVETATLTFRHWFDIWEKNGFDDGAFLEISLDDGGTWTYITPSPATPYNTTIAPNRYTPLFAQAYAGASSAWRLAVFHLDAYAGHVVRLRFHLVEDLVDTDVRGRFAGWYIDDVRVTYAPACHQATVELDRQAYGCDGASARVRVVDVDKDEDSTTIEAAEALLTSGAEPGGEPVALSETGPGTGVFEGFVVLAPSDAPGVLKVADGDAIVARYEDGDDGSGRPRTPTATAVVLDCTPPVLSGIRVAAVGEDSFRVEWTTSEPADGRVLFGTDPSLGMEVVSADLTTQHALTVSGLETCSRYFFTPASRDALGNLTRDDETEPVRSVQTVGPALVLVEEFDSGGPGWTHKGNGDAWAIGPESATGAAVTGAGGSYPRPSSGEPSDYVLLSPPFSLEGLARALLSLEHDYAFSTPTADGGWVEAWDGIRWVDLIPVGGYPNQLSRTDGGRARLGFGRVGGGIHTFDLAEVLGRSSRVRFRVHVRSGVGATGSGWRIHRVAVSGGVSCRSGRLAFQDPTIRCDSAAAPVILSDRDLDLDPGSVDTATVTAESSAGGSPLPVLLREVGPASGTFTGEVPLSASGADGTLPVEAGATVTASYLDADDGSGRQHLAGAARQVAACDGPGIRSLSVAAGHDSVILAWKTDRPADGAAVMTPEAGPALSGSDHRLLTSHRIRITGAAPCLSYAAAVASEDADGRRSTASGAASKVLVDTITRRVLFTDDMEGPDPGWIAVQDVTAWRRGVPLSGPPSAFSGQNVFAVGLNSPYLVGTDATLLSPPIDLRGTTAPRLTFWHWYDVFGKSPPNSFDDGAWVEVQAPTGLPVWIAPIQGYTDVVDSANGQPLRSGTPVYAGRTPDWETVTFDLSAFAGQVITLRFRLWEDLIDFPLNNATGEGWFIDDVEVWEPEFCFPAPSIAEAPLPDLTQGASAADLQVTGTGFREGASVLLGDGIEVSNVRVDQSPGSVRFDVAASALARVGPRDLALINPDGQRAVVSGALRVLLEPARADLNGSGRVDAADLFLMARAFGSEKGDPAYRPEADLDADGRVDGLDLALLAAHFGARF